MTAQHSQKSLPCDPLYPLAADRFTHRRSSRNMNLPRPCWHRASARTNLPSTEASVTRIRRSRCGSSEAGSIPAPGTSAVVRTSTRPHNRGLQRDGDRASGRNARRPRRGAGEPGYSTTSRLSAGGRAGEIRPSSTTRKTISFGGPTIGSPSPASMPIGRCSGRGVGCEGMSSPLSWHGGWQASGIGRGPRFRLRSVLRRSLQRLDHARGLLPRGQDRLSTVGHEDRPYQPQLRGSLRPRR